jgi:Xaa-Pro aminopeptidase
LDKLALRRMVISMPVAPALLFYSDTHVSTDLLYFGRFACHDPFIALEQRDRKVAILNALEFGRGLREGAWDLVLPLEPLIAAARKRYPAVRVGPAELIATHAARARLTKFRVPGDFPAGLCDRLRGLGLKVEVIEGPVFPARELKTRREALAIKAGNACAAAGFRAAEQLLRSARPRGRELWLDGRALTSERVRFAIEVACLEAGGLALDTIVAGGDQACDPHCRGSGPLRPRELIIVDIFPRMQASGYHGDMTRTYLKGSANDAQRRLVAAVADAQRAALQEISAGVAARAVHARCTQLFAARSFETWATPKGSVGFFHGTGHGLGLSVHELPRVNAATDAVLAAGHVVTVEPGLYYPGLGGCRIEDVALVTARGHQLLSAHPYDWEL